MNTLILKNGKHVGYDDYLVPDGVDVRVSTPLTKEEKKEFRYELQSERDVVNIFFN